MPISRHLIRPASRVFIYTTFIVALIFNLLPYQKLATHIAPDFVVFLLIYWAINQPRRIGIWLAFILGLFMDVANSSLLGQHPLAYVLVTGLALLRQRKLVISPFWQQSCFVFGLLLLAQETMVLVRMAIGTTFWDLSYFTGCLVGAIIWTPFSNLILWQQQRIGARRYFLDES